MKRRLALALLLTFVVAACGGSEEADPSASPTVGDDSATTTASTGDGAATTTSTTTGGDAPTGGGDPLFGSFDQSIQGLTPESGGGVHPLLEWTEVPGADSYAVYLYAPGGEPYWVWMGRATSVHVGGEPQLREGAFGPGVIDGMSWIVIAYDESQVPIAVSPERPIAP